MISLISKVGRGISRAFTSDGGKVSKLTDRLNRKDDSYYIGYALRILAGLIATAGAYWIASKAGVPVAEVMENVRLLTE